LGSGDIHFDSGVTTRVDDLSALDTGDGRHGPLGDHTRGPTESGSGGGGDHGEIIKRYGYE